MGHPDGAHTHGGGSSGLGTAVLALVGAALAVKVLPVVLDAVAELVRLVLIVVAVLAGVAAAGGVAYIALRVRHRATEPARRVYRAAPVAPPRVRALPEPRPAIEAPRPEVHVHHHWHGVDAADVAAIIREHGTPPAGKE
jgi:hypothetical protein